MTVSKNQRELQNKLILQIPQCVTECLNPPNMYIINKWSKYIWHKTASPSQMDGSIVFARWRQYALPCGHIGATWWIWIFLHSSWQKVPILYNGRHFPPKMAPSHWGGSGTPSNTWFHRPFRGHNPNGISIDWAIFTQMATEYPYTLQWDALSPSKLPMGESGPPYNTWYRGPTQVLNPNGISIASFLQGWLVWQTDRPCYSVSNNRLHLRT